MIFVKLVGRILLWGTVAMICSGSGNAQTSVSKDIPDGWVAYQTPADGGDVLRCANLSRKEWQVTLSDAGRILIAQDPATVGKPRATDLPPGVKHQQGMVGSHSTVKLKNGWLLGFDAGEFGGGLWFAAFNGPVQRLSSENIHGFIETARNVLIFTGLSHMGYDSGKVLTVPFALETEADLKTLVDLDGAPEAFTKVSDDAVLVVTTHGVSRIEADGSMRKLLSRNFGMLYPNSIVSTKDGAIYAGMRLFVVRLVPASGGYKQEWLLPKDCEHFQTHDYDCICTK